MKLFPVFDVFCFKNGKSIVPDSHYLCFFAKKENLGVIYDYSVRVFPFFEEKTNNIETNSRFSGKHLKNREKLRA